MGYFNKQDGLKYHFEQRYIGNEHVDIVGKGTEFIMEFPTGKDKLVEKYVYLENTLNEEWHKDATLGAAIKGDGLLTDHGVGHIADVMAHAGMILADNVKKLNGYEIYLLLLAIHFHDLGNINGREDHETYIDEIMLKMGDRLPLDIAEKNFVVAIATAHGGYVNGEKDTIHYVNIDNTCNGVKVRAKLLAAILRLADELSDDFNRSNYKGIDIPPENEVYHEYSKSLTPVGIDKETVSFHFRIPYDLTQRKIGKGNKKVFLYDEILVRLAKTMRELEYCRSYADSFIQATTLNVKIDILKPENQLKVKDTITFRLRLQGYPNSKEKSIMSYLDLPEEQIVGNKREIKYSNGIILRKAMKGEK